jgi:hypothetical protein
MVEHATKGVKTSASAVRVPKVQQQLTGTSQIDRDLIIPGPLIKERACTSSSESHQKLEEKEQVKLIKHSSK